jgi:hypothetical protein
MTHKGAGALKAFIAALISSIIGIIVFVCIFMWLRMKYPAVYSHNVTNGAAPLENYKKEWTNSAFGWFRAAFSYELAERWLWAEGTSLAGALTLDQAMLLEFTKMGMWVFSIIGVPMMFIMGQLHWRFGGNGAGEDHMSYLSFGNVLSCGTDPATSTRLNPEFKGCWIYNIHAFMVWVVVCTVQVTLHAAQARFVKIRQEWLERLPEPQATTLLIEGIPKDYRSDAKLLALFRRLLGDKVKTCHVVKYTPELTNKVAELEAAKLKLKREEATLAGVAVTSSQSTSAANAGVALHMHIEALKEEIKQIRANAVKAAAEEKDGVNCAAGFVQFMSKADADEARSLQLFPDAENVKGPSGSEFASAVEALRLSTPPDPTSIIFADLQQDSHASGARMSVGYWLVAGLYFLYLPLGIWIINIAKLVNMRPLQSVWAGLAPAIGLQVMVAFLPTFLLTIFRSFFLLKADVYAQKTLQNWCFVFHVVFVIMTTSVGIDMNIFMRTLGKEPFKAFGVLVDSMPQVTHFYMNFLVLQWVTHVMNMMRYTQLSKFLMFRKMYGSDEDGKRMAEPEDQDYHGMGSRSACFTITFCIGVIFGTLAPLVNFLCFVNFLVCRIVYGYLIPFSETKKPDTGGAFFGDQLRHLFIGNIIYCILMIVILFRRAETWFPVIVAAPSLFYVTWSMKRFDKKYSRECHPYKVLARGENGFGANAASAKSAKSVGNYVQPEFLEL